MTVYLIHDVRFGPGTLVPDDIQKITSAVKSKLSANYSRNFARVFTDRFGTTPAKAVEAMRIEASKHQLVSARTAIAEIARQCGFQDDERMRRAFLRHTGIAPLDYRRRFGMHHSAKV